MQEKNMGHICPIGRSGVNDQKNIAIIETKLAVTFELLALDQK